MAIPKDVRIYGQLVVDLANASTTDEAGLKYFNNVQKAFDLPYSFIKKAQTIFPALTDFYSSLTDSEIMCLELISKLKMIQLEISSVIHVDSLSYDIYSNKIHIEVNQGMKLDDGSYVIDPSIEPIYKNLSIDGIKKIIRAHDIEPDLKDHKKNILSSSLPELIRLGNQIASLEEISPKKYLKLYEMEDTCANIKLEHDYIGNIQKKLKLFLDKIIDTGIPHDGEMLQLRPLNEEYFTDRNNFSIIFLDKIYGFVVDYCISNFFTAKKNIEHLKKCEHCENFYIANKLYENQVRCSICSKKTRLTREQNTAYQRKYRPIKKERDFVKKQNKKIKELVQEGYTREKAEKLVQGDE